MARVTGYSYGISTRDFATAFGTFVGKEAPPAPPIARDAVKIQKIFLTDLGYRVTITAERNKSHSLNMKVFKVRKLEAETPDGEPFMRITDIEVKRFDRLWKDLFKEQFKLLLHSDDRITGGLGPNDLLGWDGPDVIVGGPEDDILDGGPGVDRLEGGAGDDTYYVDHPKDVILDPDGGRVFSSSRSYTLPEPLTSLAAAPGAKKVTLIGNGLDNTLVGGPGRDRLEGRDGADRLDGGPGADTMLGGPGDDLYLVDDANDLVVEQPGNGIDTIVASTSFTLPANVENLRLEGTAAQGIGNEEDNRIEGGGLTTLLDGRGGADTIVVRSAGDVAVTVRGGTGADRIRWEDALDAAPDTVADFAPAEGDVLDLDALLPAGASTDPLAFVRLAPAAGGALLELDVDGAAGPAGWAPLASLPGIAAGEASLRALLTSGAIEFG